MIGTRPSTAWAIRGSTVMVAGTPSKARPPWLETQTASSPRSTAVRAPFADCTPLGMTASPDFFLIHSKIVPTEVALAGSNHSPARGFVHAARQVAHAERRRRHEPGADVFLARIGPRLSTVGAIAV